MNSNSKMGSAISLICVIGVSMAIGYIIKASIPEKDNGKKEQADKMMEMMNAPVSVTVTEVKERTINPPYTFMGHVEPIEEVDLRAQVSGYVKNVKFKEGSLVNVGDVLFEIDDAIYSAAVAQNKALLAKAEAEAVRAAAYYARIKKVDIRSVTQTDIDSAHALSLQADAAVKQAQANLLQSEIDLSYTKIVSPIKGRIGRAAAKAGDYVNPASGTVLAHIVQMDPVRVVFSIPDKYYVTGILNKFDKDMRVRLRLATEDIYSEEGTLDFIDNQMSSETASLPVRIRFSNPENLLLPRSYVSVLIDSSKMEKQLTVPEISILTNAKGDFVYVDSGNGTVKFTAVKLGARADGYAVVKSGVKLGDKIVTDGVSKINPNSKITAIPVEE